MAGLPAGDLPESASDRARGRRADARIVMLSPKLLETLRSYWRATHPKHWLFPDGLPGRHLSTDAVEKPCYEVRPRHPHHSIQLLPGHRSLATTARYLRISTGRVCSTTSPLDLLPRSGAAAPQPTTPAPL